MIHADSESSIFRDGERACNGKYAPTFLFRSHGTSIPPTLNIHAILLTTFQTSLSPGTPFIFLDLCFRSPTLRYGAQRRDAAGRIPPSREIKFYPIVLSLWITWRFGASPDVVNDYERRIPRSFSPCWSSLTNFYEITAQYILLYTYI